jgi:hypothetical protein
MDQKELAAILQRVFGMVASLELATAALAEVLVESAVVDRATLLKGLIEKRDALDPKFSKGSFDALIEKLAPKTEAGLH